MTDPAKTAAQALIAAYGEHTGGTWAVVGWERRGLAAALRAAADEVVPVEDDLPPLPPMHEMVEHPIDYVTADVAHNQRRDTRRQLLAIAAELENPQP